MTSWRTGNNRRRSKALKQGGLYRWRRYGGPTWAERGATGEEILADIRSAIDAMDLAAFAELASGQPLAPWQREIARLIESTPPERLIINMPARGFRLPALRRLTPDG
jgi:hypothetical protein